MEIQIKHFLMILKEMHLDNVEQSKRENLGILYDATLAGNKDSLKKLSDKIGDNKKNIFDNKSIAIFLKNISDMLYEREDYDNSNSYEGDETYPVDELSRKAYRLVHNSDKENQKPVRLKEYSNLLGNIYED